MNIAVIFAGGIGKRMKSKEKPKQFLVMYGKPIIVYTLEVFQYDSNIDAIVVACVEEWIPHLENLVSHYNLSKVKKIVPGGETGQMSIYKGLCAAEEIAKEERNIVLIHDGVRPLISSDLLDKNIESVIQHGSAITCVDAKETIILYDGKCKVDSIVNREKAKLARAPQSFWLEEILEAHRKALKECKKDFIDSCSLMKYYGKQLHIVEGSDENIKITTPEDFYIMRALLAAKEDSQIYDVE